MSTITLGTNANNSLTALAFQSGGLAAADVATIAQNIKHQNAAAQIYPGAFDQTGQLFLPGRRGVILVKPGDYVAVDTASGWPIVISSFAIATGPWTHS